MIGLGDKVNTEKPIIRAPDDDGNGPGSFLSGDTRIWLEVEQPFGLNDVFMTIWYTDKETGEEVEERVQAYLDPNTGRWFIDVDTTKMEDGPIKAKVTAIDVSGNETITTDIIYTIKNLPPQIELAIPTVKGRDFDSIDFDLNTYLPEQDPIFVGFDLMGLATDNLGIKKGYPKIMIWPIGEDDGTGNPKDGKWNHWRSAIINADRHGQTTKRFNWPMKVLIPDAQDPTGWRLPIAINESHKLLDPGNYRFRIWVKDTRGCTEDCFKIGCNNDEHGTENFYPHRTNNERGPNGTAEVPNNLTDKFIEIKYVNQDLPIVTYMSVPSYFNGIGYINASNHYTEEAIELPDGTMKSGYPVYVTVTSSQDVLPGNVKGWITDSAPSGEERPVFESPEYDFFHFPTSQNPNRWVLVISKEEADAWYTQTMPTDPLKDADGKAREEVTLFVNVSAMNVNGDSSPPMSPRNFNFDKKPPTVIFDRPVIVPTTFAKGEIKGGSYEIFYPLYDQLNPMPRWVTGNITVGGTNLDGFVLSKIYYHIGYLGDDSPTGGKTREDIYNQDIWKDTNLHGTGIASDEHGGSWSGSLYAWNYQNNFNDWGRHKNCGVGGNPACTDPALHAKVQSLIQEGSALSDFNSTHVNYTTASRSRFYLPFYVKVVDTANNFHIIQYKLCVDPDLDIPYVSISTPTPDSVTNKTIIGGEVSLSGLATDNDWIHSVQIRIRKYGTAAQLQHANLVGDASGNPFNDPNHPAGSAATYKYYRPYRHNTTNIVSNLIPFVYETNPGFPVPDGGSTTGNNVTNSEKTGWFNAEKRNNDMVIGWFFNINTYGGLDPEGDLKSVDVRIEVRAVDSKDRGASPDKVGGSMIMDVEFSSGVPTITHVKVNKTGTPERDYFEGITGSGNFDVSMLVSDDGNLTNIRTSINGSRFDLLTNSVNLSSNSTNTAAGLSITNPSKPTSTSRSESTLTIDINTLGGNALYSSLGYGKTGAITIEVEVHDDSSPTFITRTKYTVGVDNYYPKTSIETTTNASSNKTATPPVNFELSGIASDTGSDSGSIQELSRVLVYFEDLTIAANGDKVRTGKYRNPRGKINRSAAAGSFAAQTGEADVFYNDAVYKNSNNNAVSGNWYNTNAASLPAMESYPNVREDGQTESGAGAWGAAFANFPVVRQVNKGGNAGVVWESPHAMVIDNQEVSTDLDTDGTTAEVWSGLVEKTWRAWMDTQAFTDGPYMVHYIVMDAAGNATHYMKDIFVENNKPEIAYINLGTNIRGIGDAVANAPWVSITNPGDYMRVRYSIEGTASGNRLITFTDTMDNPFRVRGNRLALHLETRKGNGTKFYKVSYVEPEAIVAASAMVRGRVYTIVTSGTTDWQKYGAVNNSVHTTFVASGPGEGNGQVLRYNEIRASTAKEITEDSGHNMANDIVFQEAAFGSAAGRIPDSRKTSGDILRPYPTGQRPANWPDGWDNSWPERLFIIKVYDTTVAGRGEEYQLAHAVLVALDIDNDDSKAPAINTADFGQKYKIRPSVTGEAKTPNIDNNADRILAAVDNYNENIVMSTATTPVRQGYVQYKEHKSSGNADISGQVIFTGKASDNQRIQNITVTIPGYDGGNGAGTAFTVATWNTTSFTLTSSRAAMGTNANQMWYFRIIDHSLSLDYGHAVNWEFGWDSSYVTNQVGTPQVQFRVNDFRSGTPTAGQSNLDVNIVPYISEVVTGLSGAYDPPSAFARSANGWYPVNETESITIRGFNLGVATGTATTVTLNGTAITTSNITRTSLNAAIGNSAGSGSIVVRVNNAVNSINNSTTKNAYFCTNASCTAAVKSSFAAGNCASGHTSAARTLGRVAYNWEPNGVNNDNLTNDRKIYVWNTGYVLNDTTIVNPFMRLDSAGNRYLAAGRYVSNGGAQNNTSEGHLKVFRNNNGVSATGGIGGQGRPGATPSATVTTNGTAAANTALYQTNRFLHTTIAISGGVGDVTGGEEWAAAASNLTSGQSNFQLVYHSLLANNANADGGNGNRRMRDLGNEVYRIQIPRIALQRTGDAATAGMRTRPVRMVLSYYDAEAKSLVLHYGTHNGNATWSASFPNDNATAPHTAATYQIATNDTTIKGGMYHSVGLTTDGRPILAWYDMHSSPTALYVSYGGTTATVAATATVADWRSRAVKIGDGVGTHVDLAVDAGNNIHIAYVDANNGGLYYTYIPRTSATSSVPLFTSMVTCRVDTFLSTGQKLMINVRTDATGVYRPYISYIHNGFAETRNSIRVAWLKDVSTAGRTNGTTGNYFTGAWEVMTVPAESIPLTTDFICNGVPNSTTASFEQPTASTLRGDTSIGNTMFVGYMTQKWYEGAILKANIRTLTY